MKPWEIIAHNIGNAGWVGAAVQQLIPTGEQSGLLTHIGATESVLLCVLMRN